MECIKRVAGVAQTMAGNNTKCLKGVEVGERGGDRGQTGGQTEFS